MAKIQSNDRFGFMCLPVIPDIKITDRHLLNTKTFTSIY